MKGNSKWLRGIDTEPEQKGLGLYKVLLGFQTLAVDAVNDEHLYGRRLGKHKGQSKGYLVLVTPQKCCQIIDKLNKSHLIVHCRI